MADYAAKFNQRVYMENARQGRWQLAVGSDNARMPFAYFMTFPDFMVIILGRPTYLIGGLTGILLSFWSNRPQARK